MGRILDGLGNIVTIATVGMFAAELMGIENPLFPDDSPTREDLEELSAKLDTLIDLNQQELVLLQDIEDRLAEMEARDKFQNLVNQAMEIARDIKGPYNQMLLEGVDVDHWLGEAAEVDEALGHLKDLFLGEADFQECSLIEALIALLNELVENGSIDQSTRYYATLYYWHRMSAAYDRGIAVVFALKYAKNASQQDIDTLRERMQFNLEEIESYVRSTIDREDGTYQLDDSSESESYVKSLGFSKEMRKFYTTKASQASSGIAINSFVVGLSVGTISIYGVEYFYIQNHTADWDKLVNGTLSDIDISAARPTVGVNSYGTFQPRKGMKCQEYVVPDGHVISKVYFKTTNTGNYAKLKVYSRPIDKIGEVDRDETVGMKSVSDTSWVSMKECRNIDTSVVLPKPYSPLRGVRLYHDTEKGMIRLAVLTQFWQEV